MNSSRKNLSETPHSLMKHWKAVTLALCTLVLWRALPHPPNFTPTLGCALVLGSVVTQQKTLSSRLVGGLLTALAVLLADALFLGFHSSQAAVFIAILAVSFVPALLPRSAKEKTTSTLARLGGESFIATGLFFLVTNFAVWLGSGLYAPTFMGLVTCYIAAIPFALSTLASTFISLSVFEAASLRVVPASLSNQARSN